MKTICGGSTEEKELRKINAKIDKELKMEQKIRRKEVKILLLGMTFISLFPFPFSLSLSLFPFPFSFFIFPFPFFLFPFLFFFPFFFSFPFSFSSFLLSLPFSGSKLNNLWGNGRAGGKERKKRKRKEKKGKERKRKEKKGKERKRKREFQPITSINQVNSILALFLLSHS